MRPFSVLDLIVSKKDSKKEEQPEMKEESTTPRRDETYLKLIIELQSNMAAMGERMTALESAQGHMERAIPAVQHPLNKAEVIEAVKLDGTQKFRVIEKHGGYGSKQPEGRILSAQHYPHLADNVAAGLRLVLHND